MDSPSQMTTLWYVSIALYTLALLGHGALWLSLVNRVHASAIEHVYNRWATRLMVVVTFGLPALLAYSLAQSGEWQLVGAVDRSGSPLLLSAGPQALSAGPHGASGIDDGASGLNGGTSGLTAGTSMTNTAVSPGSPAIAFSAGQTSELSPAWWAYLTLCWGVALVGVPLSLRRRFHRRRPVALRHQCETPVAMDEQQRAASLSELPGIAGAYWRLIVRLPGNQALRAVVAKKQIALRHLPPQLAGLRIAHLTDFHFTGHVGRGYYEALVDQTLALQPDMIFLTGDFVDSLDCFEWIGQTLGRLKAPLGVYFVLGNHDIRLDLPRVRDELLAAGFIHLGGTWQQVSMGSESLLLAGNELPWIAPAASLADGPPPSREGGPVRLLLAHSPDQFAWARRESIDLMVAGHTHGGQVRLPLLGALACPSWHGAQYACGVFEADETVMLVSRGISSEMPLRYRCAPELVQIELVAGE